MANGKNSKSKKSDKPKISKVAYYSVVAFSLAVIGAVSWFTVSRLGTINDLSNIGKEDNNQSYSKKDESYNKKEENKTAESNKTNDRQTESAANPVTDQPYEAPAQTPQFTMPVEGAVTKPYSSTALQYSKTYGDTRIHKAIDLKCEEGTAVRAAYDGTVSDIADDAAYGKVITIDHGNGISVKYCGLKSITVAKGAAVKSGDTIGTSGIVPCECKDEPHIHLEAADESGLNSILAIFGVGE